MIDALVSLQVPVLQSAGTLLTFAARIAGLAVFAGLIAATVALGYRWYVRERIPSALALLVALAGVAIVLNTTRLLAAEIAFDGEQLQILDALIHIATFVGAAGGASLGVRVGDRLGIDLFAATGTSDVDADVSQIVQSVGRVTTVKLPEEIDDIVGYDPVAPATKETLANRRFLFPRRLTKADLRDRLVARLKTDYGVGHVDVEVGDDGTVEFLAIGSRAAGIGPTLPPATNAVAIRADPAHAASAGDLVQIWETDPMRRVLTAELRGVADDVVTVAIDTADTPKLDPTKQYKLVTLPVEERPDREFASLLRASDETLATITVEVGSELDGTTIEALDATVAAITREDAQPAPLPERGRTLQPGDVLYVIATPDVLRRVETAARGTGDDAAAEVEPEVDSGVGDDHEVDSTTDDVSILSKRGPSTDAPGSTGENTGPSTADESEVPPLDASDDDPLDGPLSDEPTANVAEDGPGDETGGADVDAYAFEDGVGGGDGTTENDRNADADKADADEADADEADTDKTFTGESGSDGEAVADESKRDGEDDD